jgi:hypothetical protein
MNDEIFDTESEAEGIFGYEQEGDFETSDHEQEDVEMELAAELLSVSGEEELEQFLGRLMKRAAGAARGILGTQAGQQLKGLLRKTASRALPLAGRAVGSYLGGSSGGDFGATLASQAGQMFGLELEGMSAEDQEFEVARRVVRLATDATQRIAGALPSANPRDAAASALNAAAARHAPGLIRPRRRGTGAAIGTTSGGASGRWVRRNGRIVLYGV